LIEAARISPAAQRNVVLVPRKTPKILGWCVHGGFLLAHRLYPQAIAVLQQDAKTPSRAWRQFAFEVRSQIDRSATYSREARNTRISSDRFSLRQLPAAMADTHAQAGDQQGLKQVYIEKTALISNAPLSPTIRKRAPRRHFGAVESGTHIAACRDFDYAGAVCTKNIEIINAFRKTKRRRAL